MDQPHKNGTEMKDALKKSLVCLMDSSGETDELRVAVVQVHVPLNMKLRSNSLSKRPYTTNGQSDVSLCASSKSPKKSKGQNDSRNNIPPEGSITSLLHTEDPELKRITEIVKWKRKISFSHQSISKSLVGTIVMALRSLPIESTLRKLKMRNCKVDPDLLHTLSKELDPRKINTLDLSGNKNLSLRVVEELRKKHESRNLNLSDSELSHEEIETLAKMKQVKELRLDYNAFKNGPIGPALAELINNGLEELSLVDSRITDKQLDNIAKRLRKRVSLRVLNLSHVTLTKFGINAIGKIANKTNGMDRLVLSGCAISEQLLIELQRLVKGKIFELDFSSNQELSDGNIEIVSILADKAGSEVIDLSSISLDGTKIRQLMKTKPRKIKKLRLSENLVIDATAVGQLAESWKLSKLDISECRLSRNQISLLADSLGEHKLSCIDVSDPMATLTEKRKEALKKLNKKTNTLRPSP